MDSQERLRFEKYGRYVREYWHIGTAIHIDSTTATCFLAQTNGGPLFPRLKTLNWIYVDDLSTLPLISKLFFAPTLTSVTLVLKDTLKSHNIRNPVTSIAVGHIDMAVGDSLQHFRSLTQSSQNVLHHFCLSPATPKVLQQLSIFPCLRSLELHSYWDQYVHTHLPVPVVANLRTLSLHFEFNLPFEGGVSFDSRCDRNIVYPELIELKLCTNNDFHARTKHIAIRYHWIREAVEREEIALGYRRTEDQPADLFTKPHARVRLQHLSALVGLRAL